MDVRMPVMNDHIAKPIDAGALKSLMSQWLGLALPHEHGLMIWK